MPEDHHCNQKHRIKNVIPDKIALSIVILIGLKIWLCNNQQEIPQPGTVTERSGLESLRFNILVVKPETTKDTLVVITNYEDCINEADANVKISQRVFREIAISLPFEIKKKNAFTLTCNSYSSSLILWVIFLPSLVPQKREPG